MSEALTPEQFKQYLERVTVKTQREIAIEAQLAALREQHTALENAVREAQELTAEQAENEALWAIGTSIVEAYMQQELRRLTAAVEAIKLEAAAPPSGGTP